MRHGHAFAIWITGLPASGKSTLTKALQSKLASRGIGVEVLESDELRKILTPHPTYDEQERDAFYKQMVWIGSLLVKHGVPVIFDATANRRAWRDSARQAIPNFVEVFVDAPLELCMTRDPKEIYRRAQHGENTTVPGLQAEYERPLTPEVVMRAEEETAESAARRILEELTARGVSA